ncbi:MAG: NAD(P)H-binding protein [Arenimonas sp.]
MRVLVLGGAGFIGRHAVAALRTQGHEVLVAGRDPRHALGHPQLHGCQYRRVRFEALAQAADCAPLLAGVDAVLNCVGILRERLGETYAAVHLRAPLALAAACRDAGLPFVHVSALGLRHPHRSGFLRSKRAAELALADSGADWRIVRPSLLDGHGGYGAGWLRVLARLPLHLVARAADGRIAAFDVGELGEALARLVALPIAADAPAGAREFELGGLQLRKLADYMQALRIERGAKPAWLLRVPDWFARLASHAFDLAHLTPFSFGHWELLQHDNVPMPNRLPELLGRAPRAIGAALSPGSPAPAQAGLPNSTASLP